MSIPREMSRDTSEGLLISKYPDVCYSPNCATPYTICAKQYDDAADEADASAAGTGAKEEECTGDEAGVAGVQSGTVQSVCHRKTHSTNVRVEGEWATRHCDIWYMNCKNTEGKLCYVESTESFETTPSLQYAQADTGTVTDAVSPGYKPQPKPRILIITNTQGRPLQHQNPAPQQQPNPANRFWSFIKKMPKNPSGPGMMEMMGMLEKKVLKPNVNTPGDWWSKGILRNDPVPQPQTAEQILAEKRFHEMWEEETDSPPNKHKNTNGKNRITAECKFITVCFDRKHYDPVEYERQLKMNDHGINAMTPQEWLAKRAAYEALGSKAVRKLSKKYQDVHTNAYNLERGARAASRDNVAALHRIDAVAGGDYWDIAGLGAADVNSSIGGSWKPTRIRRMEAHAAKQAKNGYPSVMVHLSSAPGCVDTN